MEATDAACRAPSFRTSGPHTPAPKSGWKATPATYIIQVDKSQPFFLAGRCGDGSRMCALVSTQKGIDSARTTDMLPPLYVAAAEQTSRYGSFFVAQYIAPLRNSNCLLPVAARQQHAGAHR